MSYGPPRYPDGFEPPPPADRTGRAGTQPADSVRELPGGVLRVWGQPVRYKGGWLTHWAGADRDGARRLAHNDYAWTDRLTDPLPNGKECQRCVRRQPAFYDFKPKGDPGE